mgnify:CR=1 FL=1
MSIISDFSEKKSFISLYILLFLMDNITLKRGINFSSEHEEFDWGFLDEDSGFDEEPEISELKPKKPKIRFKFLVAS